MTQLRLAYSNLNVSSVNKKLPSGKCRMSRASLSKSPRLAQKFLQLQLVDPAAAVVIERLVDDAIRRRAG